MFSATVAQAQTSCPTTPEVTVLDGQVEDLSSVEISDCEWNRQEIYIAAPAVKDFLVLTKTMKRIETKQAKRFDVENRVKFSGQEMNLYKVDLKRKSLSLVLVQDILKLRMINPEQINERGDGLFFDRYFMVQPASPGVTFQTHNRKKTLHVKVGVSAGPAYTIDRSNLEASERLFPTIGMRTNLKVFLNF